MNWRQLAYSGCGLCEGMPFPPFSHFVWLFYKRILTLFYNFLSKKLKTWSETKATQKKNLFLITLFQKIQWGMRFLCLFFSHEIFKTNTVGIGGKKNFLSASTDKSLYRYFSMENRQITHSNSVFFKMSLKKIEIITACLIGFFEKEWWETFF